MHEKRIRQREISLLLVFSFLVAGTFINYCAVEAKPVYHSTYDVAFSPNGRLVAATDPTSKELAVLDARQLKVLWRVQLRGEARGLCWDPKGQYIYAAEWGAGTVAKVSVQSRKVTSRYKAGLYVCDVALVTQKHMIITANAGTNSVSFIDLRNGRERKRIKVEREPFSLCVSPNQKVALVSNLLPNGAATDPTIAACVSYIDLEKESCKKNIKLPPGSTCVRQVAVSPDSSWGYAVHTVGRFSVPTTQLDRGWVNTNALSIIDLRKGVCYATVLLDYPSQGAADPWGVAVAPRGDALWITLSGVHKLAWIDLKSLSKLLEGDLSEKPRVARIGTSYLGGTDNVWLAIKNDPKNRSLLVNDLSALYVAEVIRKQNLQALGPRGISISPDGKTIAIASYFTGEVHFVDSKTMATVAVVALGHNVEPDPVRRGEINFHNARLCFQGWLSCATCHPEGRSDGLNWDLLNDGIGNPKNTKSLLLSHKTPPAMSRGVRADMVAAVEAGFKHILFREPEGKEVEDTASYIRSLKPLKSPFLGPDGSLTEAAERGKKIFEDPEVGCIKCHKAPLFTDLETHDVGTKGMYDRVSHFDNPTLIEIWRTSPYLHDGSAATLREVLTTRNRKDQHGKTSHLSPQEISDLIQYLLSL